MELENNIKISKKNKFYLYSTFKNIKVPQIKLTNSLKENSIFSILKNRKNDIESIIKNTKIHNYEDLISYEDIPKKKKKFIKSRNIIPKMKIPIEKIENLEQLDLTERTLSLEINQPKTYISKNKKNRSLNQTNISNLNTSSDKTYTINKDRNIKQVFDSNGSSIARIIRHKLRYYMIEYSDPQYELLSIFICMSDCIYDDKTPSPG
jgi:hypothetical protein